MEDRNEPGTGIDRLWIEVKDRNGVAVPAMSLNAPAAANAIQIQGGNIVASHRARRASSQFF
jgi:hypothetical protein